MGGSWCLVAPRSADQAPAPYATGRGLPGYKQIELTERQVKLLERFSPEFRERHIITKHTGDLVPVDTFFVGQLKGVGKIYL